MEWIIALLSLSIGAGGGFYIARHSDFNKKRADTLQSELDSVNTELNEYRGRVNQHFARTAELVDVLAANSREIYNHLAEGSQKLCDTDVVKVQHDDLHSLPTQKNNAPVASAAEGAGAAITKPDEGWYEILPETEERKLEEPVH